MSDRLDQLDYYTLLGVEETAGADAIRAAFHRFALKFHPDNHGRDAAKLRRATTIYRRGAEAYRVLRDPASRKAYDVQLQQGKLRLSADADPDTGRASRRPPGGVTNARARPFWRKAQQAMKQKNWQQAKLNLQIALQHEPGSELLETKLEEVKAALKR